MSRSVADIHCLGLDLIQAALDAPTKPEAIAAVRNAVADWPAEDLRRVVTMLAIDSVWEMRPRRSRSAVREWIELRRFKVMMHGWRHDDV